MATQHNFHPELGDKTPGKCDGELLPCYISGKRRVRTQLVLKGRGISDERVLTSADLVKEAQQYVGFREYYITDAAYARLPYVFSNAVLLD